MTGDRSASADFPLLRQLFRGYEAAYLTIETSDLYSTGRHDAERLLEHAHDLPIVGLEKLPADVSNSYSKFVNLLAEIRFAIFLAKRGARVEILRDQAFGNVDGRTTPDLRVLLPGGIPALIEVTRCSGWWPKVTERLDLAMHEAGLNLRVEHVVGAELGGSVSDSCGRSNNDTLCDDVAREVVKGLGGAIEGGSVYGTVHIFASNGCIRRSIELGRREQLPLPHDTSMPEGDTWLGSFVFEPSDHGAPEMGGGVIAAHRIDVSPHEERFLNTLRIKAQKRRDLPGEHATTHYVVAVQSDEFELPPVSVLSRLTGSRAYMDMSAESRTRLLSTHPHPAEVRNAFDGEWRRLLEEWDYGQDSKYRLMDYGAYFDGAAAWAKDLSGVLVMHRVHSVMQWLPNPFAAREINDPRLLEIGLPFTKGGARIDAD